MNWIELIDIDGERQLINLDNVTNITVDEGRTVIEFVDGSCCIEVKDTYEEVRNVIRRCVDG